MAAAAPQQSPFMSQGRIYSLLLHMLLLALMIFGLPAFLRKPPEPEPLVISVDILPVAPISNVKPQEKTEPVKEKKPEAEKKTEKKAHVEANKEVKPVEKPPEPLPTKEVIKKVEKKPEKKVEKKPKDDLDSILKSVEQTAKSEESKHPTEKAVKETNKNKAVSQTYDASKPLSMSEKDSIRDQMRRCWNPPAGAKDANNLVVTLHILMNADGTVSTVELAHDESRYHSDSFFRAAADSAMRALRECSPLKNMPADKYGTWRDMEFTFDPKDMI